METCDAEVWAQLESLNPSVPDKSIVRRSTGLGHERFTIGRSKFLSALRPLLQLYLFFGCAAYYFLVVRCAQQKIKQTTQWFPIHQKCISII